MQTYANKRGDKMEKQTETKKVTNTKKEPDPFESAVFLVGKFALVFILILGLTGVFTTIDAGSRGVVTNFGEVQDYIMQEGWNWKIPIVDKVTQMNVKTQLISTPTASASKDLQDVGTTIALNYHLEPKQVNNLYQTIGLGYESVYIAPAIQEVVKSATANYEASELITQRPSVKADIEAGLRERLNIRGIIVETVSITDFTFSAEFTASIEQKVKAEQDFLRAQNELKKVEVDARKLVATANGEADSRVAKANGEAKAIDVIQGQLHQSPEYLKWLQIQQWDGKLPKVIGGATPLIDITSEAQ